jgi:hypothetical protein
MVNDYRLPITDYRLTFTEDEGFRLLWSQELTAAALLHSFRFWLLDNSKQKRGYPSGYPLFICVSVQVLWPFMLGALL